MSKLYIFLKVMNGGYTPGIAFAMANSQEEAISKILNEFSSLNESESRGFCTGTWLSYYKYKDMSDEQIKTEELKRFEEELRRCTCVITDKEAGFSGGGD
jgi:hypothetical protein